MKRIGFEALFDRLGSEALGYSANATALDGCEVELSGYLSPAHDGSGRLLLVDAPGACPDCSPAPVAALQLPGFVAKAAPASRAVRLRGRIEFGFAVDAAGNASFLRLVDARISTGLSR